MTKEIDLILEAFRKIDFNTRKAALATVVLVEGSSYRRPGARMLITDSGELTGAISGGCLEGDALRRARLVMHQGEATVVTYDTTDEDDATLGIGLGCQGVIHILIEPIDPQHPQNPVILLQMARAERQRSVIVTLFAALGKRGFSPGTCYWYTEEERAGSIIQGVSSDEIKNDAASAMRRNASLVKQYGSLGELTGFVEVLQPPVALVILGAGNDVIPLVQMAHLLGWEVTVVDGRPAHAKAERFPGASRVIVARPEEVTGHVVPDDRTFFVLMTHNYNYDLAALRQLVNKNVKYIGVLGPAKKMRRMLDELHQDGTVRASADLSCIYGPVGLDIGAEAAEEIALSIISEIKMVDSQRSAGSLRELPEAIHHDRVSA